MVHQPPARLKYRLTHKQQKREYDKRRAIYKLEYHRSKIIQIKNEYGGKCKLCGYNKNYAALVFHHKNGNKSIGINDLYRSPIESIRIEANKCILVCANCHQEIHHPELEKKLG